MSTIERILIPADFSDKSLKAYQFAEKSALKSRSVFDLIHVLDSEGIGITGFVFKNKEIEISFETISGSSALQDIISYAKKFGDLVAITTHGRSGLAHMLLSSRAEKVALNTGKTVLTIRPDPKLFEKQKNVTPTP